MRCCLTQIMAAARQVHSAPGRGRDLWAHTWPLFSGLPASAVGHPSAAGSSAALQGTPPGMRLHPLLLPHLDDIIMDTYQSMHCSGNEHLEAQGKMCRKLQGLQLARQTYLAHL